MPGVALVPLHHLPLKLAFVSLLQLPAILVVTISVKRAVALNHLDVARLHLDVAHRLLLTVIRHLHLLLVLRHPQMLHVIRITSGVRNPLRRSCAKMATSARLTSGSMVLTSASMEIRMVNVTRAARLFAALSNMPRKSMFTMTTMLPRQASTIVSLARTSAVREHPHHRL